MEDFQLGDWVRIKSRPHILWCIRKVAEMHGRKMYRLLPYDPMRGKVHSLVLYKDKEPVNYAHWAKRRGKALDDADLNEYVLEHGGAHSFDWIRSLSVDGSSLEKTDPPDLTGMFYS